jgi:hypothetical protein
MNIEFFCEDSHVSEYWPPVPAKDCIPEEYANLPAGKEKYQIKEEPIHNIKGCLPAMDFMSAGYIIFNSYELELDTKFKQFREDLNLKTARTITESEHESNIHARKALAIYYENACPVINEQKKQRVYFKVKTSWAVRTPPGYSCLVMQPFYLNEKRFTIMPAIIDTDTYHLPIPITGYLNIKENTRIRPGTPLVQIIPFKRDDWNMSISDKIPSDKSKFFIWNSYKRLFHSIKKYI